MQSEIGVGGNAKGRKAIRRQIVLPFSKSVTIAWNNIRVRFFRSMITVSSLVLAVSFLAFVMVGSDIAQGMLDNGGGEALKALERAGYGVDRASMTVAAGAKERWIVILSLLVCAVGIVNAQLMAVTERFREIGIMKCLGALDRIILRLFLLEAAMQGLAGAGAGAVAGFAFALVGGLVRFGGAALANLDWSAAGLSILAATGAGLALSLFGVAYPAYIAARMRPVLALKAQH